MAIGRIPEPGTGIPESIIAAKGDLIVGTANDTPGILSVGTNGHTLVADSSVSPTGLKWAAPSAPAFVGAVAYRSALQALTQNIFTKINLNNESIDTDGFHDNAVNNTRLTVPSGKGGYYLLTCENADIETSGMGNVNFLKNNANASATGQTTVAGFVNAGGNTNRVSASMIVAASAGDYFEVAIFTDGASKNSNRISFGCFYLGA